MVRRYVPKQLHPMMELLGIYPDLKRRGVKNTYTYHSGNWTYRFRLTRSTFEMSTHVDDFDRWANSTAVTIPFYDIEWNEHRFHRALILMTHIAIHPTDNYTVDLTKEQVESHFKLHGIIDSISIHRGIDSFQ